MKPSAAYGDFRTTDALAPSIFSEPFGAIVIVFVLSQSPERSLIRIESPTANPETDGKLTVIAPATV